MPVMFPGGSSLQHQNSPVGPVVAAAETSHSLALKLHDMDHRKRRRVVVEYVRPTTDSYIVGAG
jgi:hypothetical protein